MLLRKDKFLIVVRRRPTKQERTLLTPIRLANATTRRADKFRETRKKNRVAHPTVECSESGVLGKLIERNFPKVHFGLSLRCANRSRCEKCLLSWEIRKNLFLHELVSRNFSNLQKFHRLFQNRIMSNPMLRKVPPPPKKNGRRMGDSIINALGGSRDAEDRAA